MYSAMAVLSRFLSEGRDRLTHGCRHLNSVRGVRMDANGIDIHPDALSCVSDSDALRERKTGPFSGEVHRSCVRAPQDDESSVRAVGEIDIELGYKRDLPLSGHPLVSRAGDTVDGHLELKRNIADRIHQGVLPTHHAVQRPVRLDVVQRKPFGVEEALKSADLVQDQIADLFRGELHLPPPEPDDVGQPWVRSD